MRVENSDRTMTVSVMPSGVLNRHNESPVLSSAPGRSQALRGAFFWLSAFYFVYCARPEDWIPGLHFLPLAKITGIGTLIALLFSAGKMKRGFRDLPKEAGYLLAIICLLFVSGVFSPVWKGGAILHTIDFAKLYVAWVLTFLLIIDFEQLRRIVFIQSVCVPVIAIISILKGRDHPRLEGVLGGIYSNSNDLAFAIVLSIPFCMAFFIQTKSYLKKSIWIVSIVAMLAALFLTASRGGVVTLVVAGTVCLWHFGIRGKRFYLIVGTIVVSSVLLATAGDALIARFAALSGSSDEFQSAYGSYEARKYLMEQGLEAVKHYPLLGVGVHDFGAYSQTWQPVHMSYLQIASEAGIPVLILYLLFFWQGFRNLKQLRKMKNLDPTIKIFIGALHSSLVGFVVGACFAPEAYQFFPYFGVVYTSCLLAIMREREAALLRQGESAARSSDEAPTYKGSTNPETPAFVR